MQDINHPGGNNWISDPPRYLPGITAARLLRNSYTRRTPGSLDSLMERAPDS